MIGRTNELTPAQSMFFDVLRGLGAQLVLLGHALALAGYKQTLIIQNLGVIIFFMLSGFLIGYTVTRNKEISSEYDIRHFTIDRFSRIFVPYLPALFLVLLIDSLVRWAGGNYEFLNSSGVKDFLGSIFQLQDHPVLIVIARGTGMEFLRVHLFGSGRTYWTVALEWWLYLTFALFAFGVFKSKCNSVVWLVGCGFVMSEPMFHAVAGVSGGISLIWFFACLFGMAYRRHGLGPIAEFFDLYDERQRKSRLLYLCIGVFAMLCIMRVLVQLPHSPEYQFQFYDLGFNVWLLFTLILIFVALSDPALRVPTWTIWIVSWSAAISYSLYLTHYTLIEASKSFAWFAESRATQVAVYVVVCNIFAAAFYGAFERHHPSVRRWLKRRLLLSRSHKQTISREGTSS